MRTPQGERKRKKVVEAEWPTVGAAPGRRAEAWVLALDFFPGAGMGVHVPPKASVKSSLYSGIFHFKISHFMISLVIII